MAGWSGRSEGEPDLYGSVNRDLIRGDVDDIFRRAARRCHRGARHVVHCRLSAEARLGYPFHASDS